MARCCTVLSAVSTDRLAALRACWHPVAYADVITAPHATTLLGEPLVLWRDARGAVHAFRDVCVHRGTALSLGRVDGNEIVCAYHGWRYGADGACTAIPQLAEPTRVPARARAVVYAVCERYGIVWVALAEPAWPIPDVPELENAAWRVVRTGPFAWACDASRQVENFTDFGHFAFVHPGLLGDPAQPVVALHLPYTIVEHIDWGGHDGLVYLFASQPVADDRCIGYCLVARNYNLEQPDHVIQAFERTIFGQDQRVVESQRPDCVPFDLAAELHLTFDAVAVAYRRAMRVNGFG
ncbi:MAG: (2Fe-2S)-binding protein [Candidatus Rokuibacteriota bacterium]|nr:MAG: (2Fe-2S)-binding protein [Candidatus Rokubacteria bacterium]